MLQGGFKNPFVAADVSWRIIQASTDTFAPTDVGGYERVLESALPMRPMLWPHQLPLYLVNRM